MDLFEKGWKEDTRNGHEIGERICSDKMIKNESETISSRMKEGQKVL